MSQRPRLNHLGISRLSPRLGSQNVLVTEGGATLKSYPGPMAGASPPKSGRHRQEKKGQRRQGDALLDTLTRALGRFLHLLNKVAPSSSGSP